MPLKIGQRICTYFDGRPRFGRIVSTARTGHVVCKFEDDPELDYKMRPSEIYAVEEPDSACGTS